jgi:DNA-binding PadR family transcriptional regulator
VTSKQRINNPLALAVLVHLYEQPRHPYELSTVLRERRKEQSIRLNYGSLYTVFEALARDQYIRAIETKREGRRPEKTVYEITPEGTTFMLEWMRDLVSIPVKEYPQFEAALSLLPVLPPEEVVILLEARIRILKKTLESIEELKQEAEAFHLPRLFSIEGEYYEEMTKTELRFVEALRHDIQRDAGGLASVWREMRRTAFGKQTKPQTEKPPPRRRSPKPKKGKE